MGNVYHEIEMEPGVVSLRLLRAEEIMVVRAGINHVSTACDDLGTLVGQIMQNRIVRR